jgi:hypothetical protein
MSGIDYLNEHIAVRPVTTIIRNGDADIRSIRKVKRVGKHATLYFRLACVVSGSGKGETGKYGDPLLPKRLPIPVSVFFGAMLVLGGVYLCFRALDVAGTGCFMRADLFICSGWILLDSGAILIFVAFEIW